MPSAAAPTCGEHRSTTAFMHALAEAVFALAWDPLRLIRPLHSRPPSSCQKKSPAERADARSRNGWLDYTFQI
jgi:hypothetical protein